MEQIGNINCYVHGQKKIFTINLNNGTTPFIYTHLPYQYQSCCYRLPVTPNQSMKITIAWYRPKKEEFDKLENSHKHHVLNGGLISGNIGEVDPLLNDPTKFDINYEDFQKWCKDYYGLTLNEIR